MKKRTLIFIPLLILISLVIPVQAMVGGELDDEHTNVGAIVLEWPYDPEIDPILARLCTGTLIHERVVLSAAHCFSGLENAGLGNETLYVTFNQDAVPKCQEINPETDDDYHKVERYIKHPDIDNGKEYHDLALVILEKKVKKIKVEDLPRFGYMDDIIQNLGGMNDQDLNLIIVGYGADELKEFPDLNLDAIRRVGSTTYKNLRPLEILTSNSSEGDPIICQGDSESPIFHVDDHGKETLVGVHSRSGSFEVSCDGLGLAFKYRLDTASARDFIIGELANLE